MSKVITYSRNFPTYHPKAGQSTYFVERVWMSLIDCGLISLSRCCELSRETGIGDFTMYNVRQCPLGSKHHTIRSGHRWKAGDKFSPRVWSGRPYNSTQIIIAPDIEIVKVWDIEVVWRGDHQEFVVPSANYTTTIEELAKNDGLELNDLLSWFNKPMKGQIICWNENINY